MKMTIISMIAVILVALSAAGCEGQGQERIRAIPVLESADLFPELESAPATGRDGDSIQSRVDALRADDGQDGADSGEARSVRTIRLGRSVVTEIPDDRDSWRWSRQGTTTLISYGPPGDPPQALVVATDGTPGPLAQQMRRFLADVDPGLGSGGPDWAQVRDAIDGGAVNLGDGQVELDELLSALAGSASITAGRGLGYRSHDKSFSGWRWIGQNDGELLARFAATTGQWGPQPPMPDGMSVGQLEAILEEAVGAEEAGRLDIDGGLEQLRGLSGRSGSSRGAPDQPGGAAPGVTQERRRTTYMPVRSARMLVGEFDADGADRVRLAIVCIAGCPVAADLSALISRARTADGGVSSPTLGFDEHSEQLGLALQP